ncbi:MAG: hypothetical protein HEQ39_05585 [Rhizobacter sp.]
MSSITNSPVFGGVAAADASSTEAQSAVTLTSAGYAGISSDAEQNTPIPLLRDAVANAAIAYAGGASVGTTVIGPNYDFLYNAEASTNSGVAVSNRIGVLPSGGSFGSGVTPGIAQAEIKDPEAARLAMALLGYGQREDQTTVKGVEIPSATLAALPAYQEAFAPIKVSEVSGNRDTAPAVYVAQAPNVARSLQSTSASGSDVAAVESAAALGRSSSVTGAAPLAASSITTTATEFATARPTSTAASTLTFSGAALMSGAQAPSVASPVVTTPLTANPPAAVRFDDTAAAGADSATAVPPRSAADVDGYLPKAVALMSGNDLGLTGSSLDRLGAQGVVGQTARTTSGESLYINTRTGNLVVQRTDELLVGLGPDAQVLRTYNSQAQLDGDNNDNWRIGFYRQVSSLTGTVNTAGSSLVRVEADGSQRTYTFNGTQYVNQDGTGAHDTLSYNASSSTWTWTDGDSRVLETYSAFASGSVAYLAPIVLPAKLASPDFGKVGAVFPHWRHKMAAVKPRFDRTLNPILVIPLCAKNGSLVTPIFTTVLAKRP